jgi:hypothetical protein
LQIALLKTFAGFKFFEILQGMAIAGINSIKERKNMNREEFKQQHHDSRKRTHDDRLVVEAERGWAGQHGQHPESDEEESFCTSNSTDDRQNPPLPDQGLKK